MHPRSTTKSLLVLATVTALLAGPGSPAGARLPYPEPAAGQDPYAYQDYMASPEWPPDDIGEER
jgi:hypothetical protein